MSQLLVVLDQVTDVDIAVIFLKERILAQLVSVWMLAISAMKVRIFQPHL